MKKRKIKKIFYGLIAVILLLLIYLNTYLVMKYNVLPIKYLIVYFIIVGLIPFLLIFTTLFTKCKRIWKSAFLILEFIYIIILFFAFFYLNQTFNFSNKLV